MVTNERKARIIDAYEATTQAAKLYTYANCLKSLTT